MGQYDLVHFRGEPVTRRMRGMILETERELRTEGISEQFTVIQGSNQPESDTSSTTHTGLGVADLWLSFMGDNDKTRKVVRIGRNIGRMTMFLRGPGVFGGFSWHFHTNDFDTHGMDSLAAWQVRPEFANGFSGLGSGGQKDPVPYRPDNLRPFDWSAYEKLVQARQREDRLDDRIENLADTLDSLRKDRDHARDVIRKLQHH